MAPTTRSSKKAKARNPSTAPTTTAKTPKPSIKSPRKTKVEKATAPKSPQSPKSLRSTSLQKSIQNSNNAIRDKAIQYRSELNLLAKYLVSDQDKVFRRAAWPLWNAEKVLIDMISHPEKYERGPDP